jgi:hypothetical protein
MKTSALIVPLLAAAMLAACSKPVIVAPPPPVIVTVPAPAVTASEPAPPAIIVADRVKSNGELVLPASTYHPAPPALSSTDITPNSDMISSGNRTSGNGSSTSK